MLLSYSTFPTTFVRDCRCQRSHHSGTVPHVVLSWRISYFVIVCYPIVPYEFFISSSLSNLAIFHVQHNVTLAKVLWRKIQQFCKKENIFNLCWFVRVENEEHDKSRTQQHGFIRERPLQEHMVRSGGSWELETYFMCATIYYQSTSLLL